MDSEARDYSSSSTVSVVDSHDRSRRSNHHTSDADESSSELERDLTPGSLDVWLDLPDEIKYDPLLAPFKHRYEEQHGKLDPKDESEGDKTIFRKEAQHGNGVANDSHTETVIGLMEPMAVDDEKQKTSRKRKVTRALRVVKLTALVAGWLLLTVALLLNREKSDVVLHTAVIGGQIKEYELSPSNERVKVLITLTGPFDQTSVNRSSNVLELWLNRDVNDDEFQQDSPKWSIVLPEDELIDFSPSATESQILILEGSDLSSNGSRNGTDWGKGINGTRVTLRLNTSSSTTVPLTVSYQLDPLDHEVGLLYATALLLVLYFLIIFEIVNRTLAALLSSSFGIGVLAWGGARPTLEELVSWLDAETLLLLFSMMLLVAILAETGLFDYLAVTAYELTGGRTWPLINCLCLFTAIFSTFLDNVTTVLLMTPVTIRLCEVMELNPVPVLMSMVIFSNVGGAATPVGDPPNVIIATNPSILQANINFSNFTLHMGVGILLVAVQTYLQLRYMYRDISKLRHSVPWDIQEMRQEIAVWRRACASLSNYSRDEDIVRRALEKKVDKLTAALVRRESKGGPSRTDPRFCSTLATMKQKYRIRDKQLLIKAAVCVSFVVVVFFLHAIPELQRLSLGWTALLGALLLLLLAEREDLEPILARVEWSTLLFFAALFVMMETLSKLGLIQWIGNVTETLILRVAPESRLAVALMLVLWCVLPVNTYGAETWTLTVGLLHQFKVAQRAMERAMLEVSLKDWIRNEYIRQRTKLSGIASAFVDNIPLSTMMVRVVVSLSAPGGLGLPLAPLAWALSFGACLGGNGTLIGASANVVCAGVAEQHGYRFTFLQFLKIGFPIMIGNLIVASVYLLFCHCVFEWH